MLRSPLVALALLLPALGSGVARAEDGPVAPPPASSAPTSAPVFEGTIALRFQSPELAMAGALFQTQLKGMLITCQMKGQKMRMEILPELPADADPEKALAAKTMFNIIAIRDNEKKETTVFMPAMKMRVTQPDEELATKAGSGKPADTFAPTGRKETILGYEAEEYATANEGARSYTEMWLAKGLGAFRMASGDQGQKGQQPKSWERFLAENDLFPLRLTEWKKKGDAKTVFLLEATNIEKGNVDDAVFVLPTDGALDLGKLKKAAEALNDNAPPAPRKPKAQAAQEAEEEPAPTSAPRKKKPVRVVEEDEEEDEPAPSRRKKESPQESVRKLKNLINVLEQLGN